MRRRSLLTSLLLLPALLLGGWGSVLVAAMCAHDAEHSAAMAADHECCRAKLAQLVEHCGAASSAQASHEAMAMSDEEMLPEVAGEAADIALTFDQAAEPCLHCFSRSGLPASFVVRRTPEPKKRDANPAAPVATKPFLPLVASSARAPSARPHAPPGHAARRHLLLSVFVI